MILVALILIAVAATYVVPAGEYTRYVDEMCIRDRVKAGGPHPFGVWDFTIARIPILIVSIIYMVFIGYKLMPDIDNSQFHDTMEKKDTSSKLSPAKEKDVYKRQDPGSASSYEKRYCRSV